MPGDLGGAATCREAVAAGAGAMAAIFGLEAAAVGRTVPAGRRGLLSPPITTAPASWWCRGETGGGGPGGRGQRGRRPPGYNSWKSALLSTVPCCSRRPGNWPGICSKLNSAPGRFPEAVQCGYGGGGPPKGRGNCWRGRWPARCCGEQCVRGLAAKWAFQPWWKWAGQGPVGTCAQTVKDMRAVQRGDPAGREAKSRRNYKLCYYPVKD